MTNTLFQNYNLDNLSEEERAAALEILKQISSSGSSERLNALMLED